MSTAGPESIKRVIHPALYALLLLFVFIEFIITTVLISNYNNNVYPNDSIRDRLRFLFFTSLWSLILVPVYIFINLKLPAHLFASVASNLGFAGLTWLFWLAGAGAWTDALGGTLHCGDFFLTNQAIDISIPYCHSLRAVQAFAWMIWILFTAVLAYVGVVAVKSRKGNNGIAGPMREVEAQ